MHSNAVTRSDEAVIRIANAMFLQHNYDLFPEFNKTIVEDYQALVDLVDFGDALNAVERFEDDLIKLKITISYVCICKTK